jgi:hypothetical protein
MAFGGKVARMPPNKSLKYSLALALGLLAGIPIDAQEETGTLGPWRRGDMAESTTLADDRPNAESEQLKAKYYTPLVPERIVAGEKGVLRFRIMPRAEGWAGILVLDKDGAPMLVKSGCKVAFADAQGQPVLGKAFDLKDTKVLFSDASAVILPKTRLVVTQGAKVLDEATVDFSSWNFQPSAVQMNALLDGPTATHGFVTPRAGAYWRDRQPMFFWGGHENHVPSKEAADKYAEVYSEAGLNVMRSIALEEMVSDPTTGAINPDELDKYHYLIAQLGRNGIYFMLSCYPGYLKGIYGIESSKTPDEVKLAAHSSPLFWISPQFRVAFKNALRTVLTTPNPYNEGKALKDDPTLITVELANETGLNERRFDFNRLDTPETSAAWRAAFNKFLLGKYGSRAALAAAWKTHPLLPNEDPAQGTILIPSNYRGSRNPYGGTGQHDQYTTPRWYLPFGIPAAKNPRVVDAIEFNNTIAHKTFPFDFNDVSKPEQTQQLRVQFNEFLLKKYGDRDKLAAAWEEDPLFPWESPVESMVKDKKTKTYVPDPARPKQTVLIPTNFRAQPRYDEATTRLADPRIGDAMEFTYAVQKDWATDLATFLKTDVGLKCGVGWNGDTFHVVQAPTHLANMAAPLDVAIAACYLDSDDGDQLTSRTKNLKRFTAFGRILGRPMFAYEWSYWNNQGPYSYEYALLAALMGRTYGFDGFAHHKMAAYKYPISDPIYSLPGHDYITPLTDRPRRGAFEIAQWIMQRSRIQEESNRLIVGFPYHDVFTGGPERKMSNWAFENWLMYQIGTEDYSFQDVYDGPADRVVIHDGRGPYGDYRKAQHAILWCHANGDREGKDAQAKEKWFALHGIHFEPGQKYYLDDHYFATTEDMSDYNVVHRQAEAARAVALKLNAAANKTVTTTGNENYWAAEPGYRPGELDRQLYAALARWKFPLPFAEGEIDKVWRSRDRSMAMDTTKLEFRADRPDMQLWFGKLSAKGGEVALSRLEARSNEKQYSVALLPWDTGDFATAKTLVLWTHWNSEVTVKAPLPAGAHVYAVNWLGKRLYQVKPIAASKEALTFATIRDDDVFCYEINR